MESYALDGVAASGEPACVAGEDEVLARAAAVAEACEPGAGAVVVQVIGLLRAVKRRRALDEMESVTVEGARRIGLGVLQASLDEQAFAEVRLAGVTGADGVRRTRRADSSTSLVTMAGRVRVRRVAYSCGDAGVSALHPRDMVLNLPAGRYSWQVRKLAEVTCRSGAYDSAAEVIAMVTGEDIWGRQLQEMMRDCAADAEQFAEGRPVCDPPVLAGADGKEIVAVGVASADAKGVSMLQQALRDDAARRAAKKEAGPAPRRLGSGEKSGNKRMAETCVVFDSLPPAGEPRTAAQIMRRPRGERGRYPRAVNRAYTCDITSSIADAVEAGVFAEIDRRDPLHQRQWTGLVDGNNDQIRAFRAKAAERGMDMPLLIDFIHVLGYLRKAAGCFTPAGKTADPAAGALVTGWGEAILLGRSADVAADIARRAADDPPRPRSERAKSIRTTLAYLENKEPYLDYPAALANGWPISTGIIEGACRHLVGDRMGITGARWSLAGAQSVLWMRAIHASGDTHAYWTCHINAEHHRNHLSKYHNPAEILTLAARPPPRPATGINPT